jgi:hypothetical protein
MREIRPPLPTPRYLGLLIDLAQSLQPSQAVRAWTFLYPEGQQSPGSEYLFRNVSLGSSGHSQSSKGSFPVGSIGRCTRSFPRSPYRQV